MTRLLLALAAMGALVLLGRRLRVEPVVPAPIDDVDWLFDWVMEPHDVRVENTTVVPPRAPYLTTLEWRN